MTPSQLQGKRLLITGASGTIGSAIARRLAAENEVFGVARFGDQDKRRELEAAGVRTVPLDLVSGDFATLPDRIDHVLHLAVYQGMANTSIDEAMKVNALGTGRLLSRYRDAEAALVMSTGSVYLPHPDPWHLYHENDHLSGAITPGGATYVPSKIAQEAVARFCSVEFDLPVVIARMNVPFGAEGGMPTRHVRQVVAGEVIKLRNSPLPYTPIHFDDIARQTGPLLGAAVPGGLMVNFSGDEAIDSHEWIAYIGELIGKEPRIEVHPQPGTHPGVALDWARRKQITGPCLVEWRAGMKEMVETMLG